MDIQKLSIAYIRTGLMVTVALALMCLLVMALGRLPVASDILKLTIQILSGAVFYTATLYLAKDKMLRELLGLIPTMFRRLIGRKGE